MVCEREKEKKGRTSVEILKVSSTMVTRALSFTFTQHAGDCERYKVWRLVMPGYRKGLPLSKAQGRMPRASAGDFFLNVCLFINSDWVFRA